MTIYSAETAFKICEAIADGQSLRSICAEADMPAKSTVLRWLADDQHEGFLAQYELARQAQADAIVDEIVDIADDATNDWMERLPEDKRGPGWDLNGEHVQRSKLRIDTRKWLAARLRPKVYGDKLDLTSGGDKLGMAEALAARRERAASGKG